MSKLDYKALRKLAKERAVKVANAMFHPRHRKMREKKAKELEERYYREYTKP